MKYKVNELEGALLDAAVAKASGWRAYVSERGQCFATVPDLEHGDGNGFVGFSPSSSWEDGGPIIERERIASFNSKGVWFAGYEIGSIAEQYYDHESVPVLFEGSEASGPTLLVAAMRAYVSSRFGEEVELP